MNEGGRFAVVACAVTLALLTATALKRRAAYQAIPAARRILPPGSAFVLPAILPEAAARAADPKAAVREGAPRMFHLDPARRNRSPFKGPINPVLAWVADTGDPSRSAPAVMPNGTIIVGTLGGNILGFDANGKTVIKKHFQDRVYTSPLVEGQRVFVGCDNDRFMGLTADAIVQWSLTTEDDADTSAAPTSDHGIVFASGPTVFFVRHDGSVVWRVKGKRKFFSSPAIGPDGTIFIGSQDNRLYAIRRVGTIRFTIDLGQDVDCTPAVDDDGTVFVGTDGGSVVAADVETGKAKWTTAVGGHVRGGVTVTRSHDVVVGVYGPSPRVVYLRGDTGDVLWSFAVPGTGATEFGVHGSPVEDAEGNLYFGAQDDVVYALSPMGKLRWKLATGGDVDAPVVLAEDRVLLAVSDDGKLYRIVNRGVESGR